MKTFHILLFVISVFMFSACQSSFITDLTVRSGERLYWEDFSDPASGWLRASSINGGMDYTDGTYRILVIAPDYDLWAVSGQVFRDVKVEVDAARLAGPAENRFGLICRYLDADNFYFFIISSDGYYSIGKVGDGMVSLLGQEMMAYSAAIAIGGANHLSLNCFQETLTAYVNGQLVAISDDPDFSSGDAGLLAGSFDEGGVDVIFDNFVVTKP